MMRASGRNVMNSEYMASDVTTGTRSLCLGSRECCSVDGAVRPVCRWLEERGPLTAKLWLLCNVAAGVGGGREGELGELWAEKKEQVAPVFVPGFSRFQLD